MECGQGAFSLILDWWGLLGRYLFKINYNGVKQINHLSYRPAWHKFYKYIRKLNIVADGKYLIMQVKEKYISIKRMETILPKFMINEDGYTIHQ